MPTRYTVTRTVEVNQAIVIKASSESEAKELARKTKFKDWSSENGKRSNYQAVEFNS